MNLKFLIVLLVPLILVSGCIQNGSGPSTIDPKTIYEIQKFLNDNPNLSFSGTIQSAPQVAADNSFKENCVGIEEKEYYKVVISDNKGELNGVAWIDTESGKLACFYKKALFERVETGEVKIEKTAATSSAVQNQVRFVVTTQDYSPVKNAAIRVYASDTNGVLEEKKTNSEGLADFYLVNGKYFFDSEKQDLGYIGGEDFKIENESIKIQLIIKSLPDYNQGVPDFNVSPDSNQGLPDVNVGTPDTNQGFDFNYSSPDSNQGLPDLNQVSDVNVSDLNVGDYNSNSDTNY